MDQTMKHITWKDMENVTLCSRARNLHEYAGRSIKPTSLRRVCQKWHAANVEEVNSRATAGWHAWTWKDDYITVGLQLLPLEGQMQIFPFARKGYTRTDYLQIVSDGQGICKLFGLGKQDQIVDEIEKLLLEKYS